MVIVRLVACFVEQLFFVRGVRNLRLHAGLRLERELRLHVTTPVDADEVGHVHFKVVWNFNEGRPPWHAHALDGRRVGKASTRPSSPTASSATCSSESTRSSGQASPESAVARVRALRVSHHHRLTISATPIPSRIQRSSLTASHPA